MLDAYRDRIRELEAENRRLTKERDEFRSLYAHLSVYNTTLTQALKWYAGDGSTYDGIDIGQRARSALHQPNKEESR
ncbi:hypothetical protein [Microvirga sp. Mcv34]|uniref:hypothetical protein n=1 Tax=Microvirga sp. Mcv34 TaxID=2926016 RepID=UPI0021C87F3C|nr:hypothetical protein [Microvirga sp. Mcv34]